MSLRTDLLQDIIEHIDGKLKGLELVTATLPISFGGKIALEEVKTYVEEILAAQEEGSW